MVKIIAMSFLFLVKNTEMKFPRMAPRNHMMMMIIELLGVLWKRSTPISSIFCPMAVEIARKAPIGKSNRMYFLMIPMMFGIVCLNVWLNGFISKC